FFINRQCGDVTIANQRESLMLFRLALVAVVLVLSLRPSTAQTIADRMQRVVQPYVDAQMFMGSILAAKDGKVIFSRSYGMADLGYMVLGYLIEKISGQTYEAFVQENIFKPLAMHDSGMFSNDTVIPRRATGYWPGDIGIENADRPDWRIGFSAGSLYSTTQD